MRARLLMSLLLLVALPAWGRPDAGPRVLELLAEVRVDDAAQALADVPAGSPWFALGTSAVAFYRGDYARAAAALPAEPLKQETLVPWLRPRVQAAAERQTQMLERREGDFVFRFQPGVDAILVDYAAETLQRQRAALEEVFGRQVHSQPVVIEIFGRLDDFIDVSGLPWDWVNTTNTVAIAKWDRVMMLSPLNMARGFSWRDTLAHEYTHLVLARASDNRAPVWFQEGTARVLESRWRRAAPDYLDPWSETLLARGVEANALVTFEQMNPSMAALPSSAQSALAYVEVATALDALLRARGEEGFRDAVELMRRDIDPLAAVERVLDLPAGGFDAWWRQQLDALDLEARADLGEIGTEIAPGADAGEADAREIDPLLAQDERASDLARVGDLLRARGHHRAALVEYERAAGTARYASPSLANKRARSLAVVGRADEAREVLDEAAALYPDYTPVVALMAQLALEAGDCVQGRAAATQAIGLNPFDPTPHRVLAECSQRSGDEARARRELAALRAIGDYLGVAPEDASHE